MSLSAIVARRVVTCDPELGVLEDAAVVCEGARVVDVTRRGAVPSSAAVFDAGDRVVTPGLVDAHTHACWVGSRHAEYAIRMAGGDYRDIASAGGGIVSSHRAIAGVTDEALDAALEARLRRMVALGVTTVEVKSGYGLTRELELRQLEAIARVAERPGLPSVVPTFLALHALPPGAARSEHVASACHTVAEVAGRGLARFVDAYVDANAFTVDEARALCRAARSAGLGVRLHVGQFADVGGAELAAEVGAASADHLEHVSPQGIAALARAGVHAVLLPVASFTLGQEPPPVAAMRGAGVPIVVASDANPGTAPTESLPLAIALAVRLYGLSPDAALLGATRLAAASLGLGDRGVLRAGARADVVVWDLPHEHAIVQPWGTPRTHRVLVAGETIPTQP